MYISPWYEQSQWMKAWKWIMILNHQITSALSLSSLFKLITNSLCTTQWMSHIFYYGINKTTLWLTKQCYLNFGTTICDFKYYKFIIIIYRPVIVAKFNVVEIFIISCSQYRNSIQISSSTWTCDWKKLNLINQCETWKWTLNQWILKMLQ